MYNISFAKGNHTSNIVKIIINNKTHKTTIKYNNYSHQLNFINILTGSKPEKDNTPNMAYIESLITDYNINLLRIMLGDIEYKNSLQPIFDIESLKKDSNDFQNFINHENIFGVIDLKQLVIPQKKLSSLDKIVNFISPSLKVNNK